MASVNYMTGRKQYARPQALLLANNPGTVSPEGFYIPDGNEVGAAIPSGTTADQINNFIILSDDNRGPIDFNIERIENRQRMINGRMRSYHIADKLSISVSWDMLPSRSFKNTPEFNSDGSSGLLHSGNREPGQDNSFKILPNITNPSEQYTTDGGAGGVDILNWYENNPGSFWAYIAYDKRTNFSNSQDPYSKLQQYNEIVEVFFGGFDYSVVKRGGATYDFWNISFTLEEV